LAGLPLEDIQDEAMAEVLNESAQFDATGDLEMKEAGQPK